MANLIRRNREGREMRERGPESMYWDPFRLVESMLRWEPFRTEGWMGRGGFEFAPSVDVKETKDGYHFKADLPGVKDTEVDVSITGNVLRISGQREEEQRVEGETYHATERAYGTFSRVFSLPEGVEANGVKAELKNGVLTVYVPKRPEVQPRKITVGKGGKESEAKA